MGNKIKDIFDQNRHIDEDIVEDIPTTIKMEQVLEQLSAQIAAIADQMNKYNQKQNEHDQVLTYLNQKIEAPNQEPLVENIKENPRVMDLFRIPDPIKSIPIFDGNKKQVTAWLKTAEDTLRMFEPIVPQQQLKMYIQAVKNKIEGKAKDILCLAGDPESFAEVKDILLDALGDKQELSYYKSQLMKEIIQNIKTLAKQNPLYNNSWQAICLFIDEDALAAFISGLRKPYFGYAQAAKPKCIEEAYAFLCKFSSNESISNTRKQPITNNYQNTVQKPGNWNQTNFTKQDYGQMGYKKPNNFEKSKPFNSFSNLKRNEMPTPMEIDPSLRTRQSFNKKMVNTHEVCEDACSSEPIDISNNQNCQDNIDLEAGNFQTEPDSDTED